MNRNYVIYSIVMHLSLLICAFIITQLSQVRATPKHQKVTIKSISSGSGARKGHNIASNTSTTREGAQGSAREHSKEKQPKKEIKKPVEKLPPKTSEPTKTEAKAPPKQVKKRPEKEKKVKQNTTKQLKREIGVDESSRNSKNASLVESALSSITQDVEQSSRNKGAVAKAIAKLEGEGTTNSGNMDYGTYVDIVGTVLKKTWFYPNLGRDEKLRTTIRIFVDGTGKILSYKIERSSGREDFDSSAVRSIEQYTHFPVPPNRKPVDFVVNFNLLEE